MSRTQLVLLGTGTPIYQPGRAQQACAVVVDEVPYLIDCGDGAMIRIAEARRRGIRALHLHNLRRLFLTHLHPDHTCGLPGLLIGPWVLERKEVLQVHGPTGTRALVDGILAAYETGIAEHRDGILPIDHALRVEVHDLHPGVFFEDERLRATAFPVEHGGLEAYGFKLETPDKVIVHSGDTRPVRTMAEQARGCDLLVHEVYYREGLVSRPPEWQRYHRAMHTDEIELAEIARAARPGKLVLNHQMIWGGFHEEDLLASLAHHYEGEVVWGRDLDVFE